MKKIVINQCYGGFSLSDKAYERLIELGIPVVRYDEKKDKKDEKVIYDRELTPQGTDKMNDIYWQFKGKTGIQGRYWETWLEEERTNLLLIKVIEELGEKASERVSKLNIIEIPNNVKWQIEEYDGCEHISEQHRTWR